MRGVWRSIFAARAITSVSHRGRSQRKEFFSLHSIKPRAQSRKAINTKDTLSSSSTRHFLFLSPQVSFSIWIALRDRMDIDKQEEKTTGADGGDTSHDHDSLSHDIPVPTSVSDIDCKQKVKPIETGTVDASHERPSDMSHDSTAELPPADRSGIPDSNEEDSPGSSPPHSSPQGDGDGGGGMGDVYTRRGYTSEIFKIELNNLPKKLSFTDIKSHLVSLKLNPVKIKKPASAPWLCYINFKCEEDRQAALKALEGHVWKKRTLTAKVAMPAPDPLTRRKRKGKELDEGTIKRLREEELNKTPEERLSEVVTPLLSTPYSEQLTMKEKAMSEFMKKMAKRISSKDSYPGRWFSEHVKQNDGLMCRLEPIRASPVQTGYRNKCEFSIALSPSTGRPVVGFRLGSYEEGEFTVVSADSCAHVPDKMKQLAKSFEDYLCESSLPPLNSRTEEGYWRMLAVRCYRNGDTMAVIQMHPQQLTEEELSAEKRKLAEYFESGLGSKSPPTSLYFQAMGRRVANYSPPYEHLLGTKSVHEDMLGMRFRISPDAFFQVNTAAAEVLYSTVKELATSKIQKPVIYDICCGTGTIGLYLAKSLSVRKVVGVEMVEQAVDDARVNATLNDVSNSEFVCGKAEDVMPQLQKDMKFWEEAVGVVDPPRAGLHTQVIDTIRKSKTIGRLVYVSCNPDGASRNLIDLCRRKSRSIKGLPFRPVCAIPVDLFPHTPHCELVILLERIKQHELAETDSATDQSQSPNLTTVTDSQTETETTSGQ